MICLRFADGRRVHPAMQSYFRSGVEISAHQEAGLLGLGASYFDDPEPRLAILGPPAVTRLMFELWRTEPRLASRFDLANPLHRRDYALWLEREGWTLGLDQPSISAALAIISRGSSLDNLPPCWPAQAEREAIGRRAVHDWLAEPVASDPKAHSAGVPIPRALALLWELRRDVRLHFPNRTHRDVLDYVAWCLTQGIRDGCVPVELIEPALAGFLDAPDAEMDRRGAGGGPPLTRLMRMMAPLYDGPFPRRARDFPHTRQARLCIAIWLCGALRRRFGWPRSFVDRPLCWMTRIAPTADAFLPLDNLVVGLWKLRPDLQARCDLGSHEGRSALLQWFAGKGRVEFELDDCIPGGLAAPRPVSPERSVAKPATRRDLCLVGYAGLISGRAEDLRTTALALGAHNRQWAVLDRMSGAITTEDGRPAAGFAAPPHVNLVHLNADTALFDFLFLRQAGIERSYTIGYWAWELAKFPEEWRSSFAFVQEIWASSRFAYDAIASATTKPVMLMPMAVAVPPPEPRLKRADFGLPEDKFVFHFSFDFRSYVSRKNPLAAVAAFRRAFPQRDAAAFLLLKTIGSGTKTAERGGLGEAIRDDPRILLIDCELTRPRAVALLALSDCFLSLHRSEGFGRGPAEAMLLGKPVIATDYSGTSDFATRKTALLVDYRLVPVGVDEYPGAAAQVWAEADIDHAALAMRKIAADPALAARLGNAGRARIRELYDPVTIGARYVERLKSITKAM